ncbi:MAG TPA: glycerol-3-phosphate acyltransferase [Anaerolineae bacterium]|nr:glycerol-3-phosphate acyltransferase [Anaerolineae bacterium]
MDLDLAIIAVAAGYLMGSVSFARLVTRWVRPDEDVTKLQFEVAGTEERAAVDVVGANAASMILGPKLGLLVAVLDMLKVAVPMLAFKLWFPGQSYFLLVAIAGLAGHNWPVYYRFMGGRGFSVIVASFFVLDWLGPLVTIPVGILLGVLVVRNLFVAYVAWLWLMVPWLWFRSHDAAYVAYAIAANLVFLIATLPEIRTFVQYRREGKLDAYMEGLTASSPRWRGMKKIADRLRQPGK